jgi:ribosomal protein S4E
MNAVIPLLILIGQLALKYGDNVIEAMKVLLQDDIDVSDIQKLRDLVKPPEDYFPKP